ncbi:PREDICTED: uncharacterized protein LOC104824306 isoform X2 [Tarenaya hassleriana]|uniref:uncharacterized protein LOC104824306 isoform X2 n=1 Tax=Tarenaya hassleriana TaxID=28532 RepID=UPI00053C5C8F|nr:PREDICTED: uncharacterized protein LOC104824306 isoform X2 [Tarenaya hassleriana]
MADPKKRDFVDDHNDQSNGGNTSEASPIDARSELSSFVEDISAESSRVESENESTDVVDNDDDGDRDLFLDEDRVLRWLQALDMQVMGACRADERLKPLLKLNVSNGMAEDRLLAHLSQHFEPAEIGMLARCFCIPLVSVRVGKIKKEGTRMCPTATRGNLSLMLLPTSDLRLSFVGDNGHSERLFTFSSKSQSSAVSIEDISADSSGRSFVIRTPDGRAFYYWCSEKSKLLGTELRRKMKDLIRKKPSISELTGIDESRLGRVASHLRSYLMGSVVPSINGCSSLSFDSSSSVSHDSTSSSCASKSHRTRHSVSQPTKASSFHQGSLSPRSSSFKEITLRNSSSRISSRDKSRRRSDGLFSAFDNLHVTSISNMDASMLTENETAGDNRRHGPLALAGDPKSANLPRPQLPSRSGSPPVLFSPYYCWCPPNTSTLHSPFSTASQQYHPPLSIQLSSLPPLSSLLPPSGSDGILNPLPPQQLELDLSEIPPLLPDSLPSRLPSERRAWDAHQHPAPSPKPPCKPAEGVSAGERRKGNSAFAHQRLQHRNRRCPFDQRLRQIGG